VTLLSNPAAPHFLHGFGSHSLRYMPYFSPSIMASLIFYFLSYICTTVVWNESTSAHRKLYASDISVFSLLRNETRCQLSCLASPHQNNFSSVFWKTRFKVLDGHHARTKTLFCSMLGWWGAVFALSCLCYHVIMETNESH
jgi:hypothetical protein